MAPISTRLITGFDAADRALDCWDELLEQGDTNVIFLTQRWLRAWWETLGEGDLLLVAAERAGQVVALAPLFALEGMVFFLGAGESDYLDFIGQSADPAVLAALLTAAREHAPDFVGFRLHLIPDRSRTVQSLREAAARLELDCVEEAELPSVEVDLTGHANAVRQAVNRSMLERENFCRNSGTLEVRNFRAVPAIQPQLAEFYGQHLARWEAKGLPSQFSSPQQRAFLERFLELAADTDWVRFLRIDWNGRPFAFEFAWYYRGAYYGAPGCFDVEFAKLSPGQILLRQSVLAALEAGLRTYDLGGGDQAYKLRLPAHIHICRTWGLYPKEPT